MSDITAVLATDDSRSRRARSLTMRLSVAVMVVALLSQIGFSAIVDHGRDLDVPLLSVAVVSTTSFISIILVLLGIYLALDTARDSKADSLQMHRADACLEFSQWCGWGVVLMWIWGIVFYIFRYTSQNAGAAWVLGLFVFAMSTLLPGIVAFGMGRPFASQSGASARQKWILAGTVVTALLGTSGIAAVVWRNTPALRNAQLEENNKTLGEINARLLEQTLKLKDLCSK